MIEFTARIERQGILRCVIVPAWVGEALGGPVPVRGRIGGQPLQSTLRPAGEGQCRLFVPARIYRALGVDAGDLIDIGLEHDPDPVPDWPEDLSGALEGQPESKALFQALTPARRREIIRYLEAARRPDTRARRLQEILDRLPGDLGPRKPPLLD